nr:Bax inhibitor-1/YccA family protein [uncultured Neokomagataea sp.]
MAFNTNFGRAGVQAGVGNLDDGLRAYMCRVFNWMALGLVITGAVAYAVAETALHALFFHGVVLPNGMVVQRPTLLGDLAIFAPMVFVFVLSFGINRLSRPAVQALFLVFSATMGASLANILLSYTGVSVARAFFISATMFAAMALWGYTTRTSLARLGSFLLMGLIGLLVASLVNIFLHSSAVSMLSSVVGVGVFTLLAAYDTQRIKVSYQNMAFNYDAETVARLSIYDALSMYLNFINLFQYMLQFFGVRSGNND